MKAITSCPHCGSDEGIMTKTTLVNIPWMCGFNYEEQDNGEMYDNAQDSYGGKMCYCQSCGKAIARLSTFQKQWKEMGINAGG